VDDPRRRVLPGAVLREVTKHNVVHQERFSTFLGQLDKLNDQLCALVSC
jgi:hypothetical protein